MPCDCTKNSWLPLPTDLTQFDRFSDANGSLQQYWCDCCCYFATKWRLPISWERPAGTAMRPPIWEWDHFDLNTLGLFGRQLSVMIIWYSRCFKQSAASETAVDFVASAADERTMGHFLHCCFHCCCQLLHWSSDAIAVVGWHWSCLLGRSGSDSEVWIAGFETGCPWACLVTASCAKAASWIGIIASFGASWADDQRRRMDLRNCGKSERWLTDCDPIWCLMGSSLWVSWKFFADYLPNYYFLCSLKRTDCEDYAPACYCTVWCQRLC